MIPGIVFRVCTAVGFRREQAHAEAGARLYCHQRENLPQAHKQFMGSVANFERL
jgi:hypothetical protein